MDTLRLLDQLHDLTIEKPSHLPFIPLYWGLDKDEISLLITKIRASLPQEMKTAANTARESERLLESAKEDVALTLLNAQKDAERILVEAQQEAERILEQARLKQQQMVAESEVLKLSKAQSEEIRNAADRDSLQMRRGAEKYAYDVLSQLEHVLSKAMTTVNAGKQEMAPSVEAKPAPQNVKVK
jgi:hypothetical protein